MDQSPSDGHTSPGWDMLSVRACVWLCWTHLWLNKLIHEHDAQIVDQADPRQHAAQPARPHAHHLTVQRHHLQAREENS